MDDKPWIAAINRLMRAELRRDPRPKPHKPAQDKYWNAADLAAAADIRENTLSDVMNGKREPSLSTLLSVAKALSVPVSALLMDTEEAAAYVRFHQNHTVTTQTAALETTVRRVLEERAEEMKAAWLESQMREVMGEMGNPKVAPIEQDVPRKKRA